LSERTEGGRKKNEKRYSKMIQRIRRTRERERKKKTKNSYQRGICPCVLMFVLLLDGMPLSRDELNLTK